MNIAAVTTNRIVLSEGGSAPQTMQRTPTIEANNDAMKTPNAIFTASFIIFRGKDRRVLPLAQFYSKTNARRGVSSSYRDATAEFASRRMVSHRADQHKSHLRRERGVNSVSIVFEA